MNALLLQHIGSVIKEAREIEERWKTRQHKTPPGCGFCQPNIYESCYLCSMSVKDNRHKVCEQSTSAYPSESGSRDEMGENVFQSFLFTLLNPLLKATLNSLMSLSSSVLNRKCIRYRDPTLPFQIISYL